MKRKQPGIPKVVVERVINAYFSSLGKARIESLSAEELKKLARKGGQARAHKLTKKERSRIAALGGKARATKRKENNLKRKRGNKA